MSRQRAKPSKDKNLQGIYFNEFKPKTTNQSNYIRNVAENDVVIGEGPAGCGKTFLSIGLACQYLLEGKIRKILVSRTIIGCDNELGFFPGDVGEKVAPYMLPYLEYFKHFIGTTKTTELINYGSLSLYPVELLRGHTYDDTFMILDESQDVTIKQVKLFLTRMGNRSKLILIGDRKQSDLEGRNGLDFCLNHLSGLDNVAISNFDKTDIMRHPIIPHVLDAFEKKGY